MNWFELFKYFERPYFVLKCVCSVHFSRITSFAIHPWASGVNAFKRKENVWKKGCVDLHLGHLHLKQNFSRFHIHAFLPIDVCTSATESRLGADANKLQTTPTPSHSLYFLSSWKNLASKGSVLQPSVCGGVDRRARSRHPHPGAPVKTAMQNNNKRSAANPLPYVAQCGSRPVAYSDQLSHLSSACPQGVRLIGLSLFSFFTQWWLRSADSEVSSQHTGFPMRTRPSDKLQSEHWASTSLVIYVMLVLVRWWWCLCNGSASFILLTLH